MKTVALSIAGPFAYWIASGHEIKRWGKKSIELRSWTRREDFRNVQVLLHVSSTKAYDECYSGMDFGPEKAPKYSIVGAAILSEIRQYETEEQWERDRRSHCFLSTEPYEWVREHCYLYPPPYGHLLSNPVLFSEPILDVPGDRAYWTPNPKKLQFERQEHGFQAAIAQLEMLRAAS